MEIFGSEIGSFGSHSAVFVDNPNEIGGQTLFDPAGSYIATLPNGTAVPPGSGNFYSGNLANLDDYITYQESLGSTVNVYSFPTTPAEETSIVNNIIGIESSPAFTGVPLMCAVSCADAIRGIGPFENLGTVRTPGGLEEQIIKLQESQVYQPSTSFLNFDDFNGSAAGGGFVLYPSKPNTNTLQSVYQK